VAKKAKKEELITQRSKQKPQRLNQLKLKKPELSFQSILKSDWIARPPKFFQYQMLWGIARNICANEQKKFLIKRELKNSEGQISKYFLSLLKSLWVNRKNTIQKIRQDFPQSFFYLNILF
jgi:uncharacterized Zn finger protein